MAAVFRLAGLSWRELFRIVGRGAARANVRNRAAELAFWFLLGFFPMLLCVTSIVSMIGSAPGSQGTLMKYVGEILPSTASRLVRQVLAQTTGSGRIWLSLLFALWSSFSATAGLIDTLNAIYDLKESRPWWKSRLVAVILAIALGVLLTAALIIVVYGPELLRQFIPGLGSYYLCLVKQSLRISTATAIQPSTIARVNRATIVRILHQDSAFAKLFISFLLGRIGRIEEEFVDQIFSSSEKRLARILLLLASFGLQSKPEPAILKVSQETLAEMVGTTRSRVSYFMNRFRKMGLIDYNGSLQVHRELLTFLLQE